MLWVVAATVANALVSGEPLRVGAGERGGHRARTGAQHLDTAALHAGYARVAPAEAATAARTFAAAAGMHSRVAVADATVTVTVTTTQPMRILPLGDRPIAATASATAVSDVLQGTP